MSLAPENPEVPPGQSGQGGQDQNLTNGQDPTVSQNLDMQALDQEFVDQIPAGEENSGNWIPRSRVAELFSQVGDLKAQLERLEMNQRNEEDELKKAKIAQMEKDNQFEALYREEKANREAAEREKEEARLMTMRIEVGNEMKLPRILWPRLMGQTKEEMKLDAAKILDELPKVSSLADGTAGRSVLNNPRVLSEDQFLQQKANDPTYRDPF